MPFLARLDAARERRNLTVKALADKAGVSYPNLSKLINGAHRPTRRTAYKLARALETTPEALGLIDVDIPAGVEHRQEQPAISASPIFGIAESRQWHVVNLPEGVIKYRVRFRQEEWATIFLKFEDRLEEWYVVNVPDQDGAITACRKRGPINANVRCNQ